MWKINASSYGSMTTLIDTDGSRSVRVGDVMVSNPQGSTSSFRQLHERHPKNPDYWTINYEHPGRWCGEIARASRREHHDREPSESAPNGSKPKSEAFAAVLHRHAELPRQRTCGASHSPADHWTW